MRALSYNAAVFSGFAVGCGPDQAPACGSDACSRSIGLIKYVESRVVP